MCIGMSAGSARLRIDMCVDMRYKDMCIDTSCKDMCRDRYVDGCIDMCMDMRIDMCVDKWRCGLPESSARVMSRFSTSVLLFFTY